MQDYSNALYTLYSMSLVPSVSASVSNQSRLHPRYLVPEQSCWGLSPFPNQQPMSHKLVSSMVDATNMIHLVISTGDFATSTAYNKYFRSTQEERRRVNNMYTVMYDMLARNRRNNQVPLFCGDHQDELCTERGGDPFAVTRQEPYNEYIVFCDRFFDPAIPEVQRNLRSEAYDANGWCRRGQNVGSFLIAAVNIIHEMTHLDILGFRAGFPVNRLVYSEGAPYCLTILLRSREGWGRGTLDVYDIGSDYDREAWYNLSPIDGRSYVHAYFMRTEQSR